MVCGLDSDRDGYPNIQLDCEDSEPVCEQVCWIFIIVACTYAKVHCTYGTDL